MVTPPTVACQAPLSFSLPEFTQLPSIESVMLSNHPILCCSLTYTRGDSLVHDIGGKRADETDTEAPGGRSPRGGGSVAGRALDPPSSHRFPVDVPHTSVRTSSQGGRGLKPPPGKAGGPGVDERLHQTAGWRGLGRHECAQWSKSRCPHILGTGQPNQPLQGLSLPLFSILTKKYDFYHDSEQAMRTYIPKFT